MDSPEAIQVKLYMDTIPHSSWAEHKDQGCGHIQPQRITTFVGEFAHAVNSLNS
jgi:hypothetical protein